MYQTKTTSRKHQQPWFTSKTRRLTQLKKRWFKKMKDNKSEQVKKKYQDIKRET